MHSDSDVTRLARWQGSPSERHACLATERQRRCFRTCGALIRSFTACAGLLACDRARAGDNSDHRVEARSLIPGDGPGNWNSDARVEVRRATPVLDPNDPARISLGSVWKSGVTNEAGMFADRRARRRGDVLTMIVAENSTITNTLAQQTAKTNNVSSVLDQFVLKTPKNLHVAKQTGDITPNSILGLTAAFTGNAQTNQQLSLAATGAVTVTDVLPNGNLVLEGTRIISFNGENKYMEMSGIVRGDDVAANNTILSSNVADAKVRFLAEGSLTDAQKKGWLSRGVDRFNPL